ncbi:MAG: hypothetical protein ACI8QS_001774 [Planctomycetota bacterium]|jgi:hypothetical protein
MPSANHRSSYTDATSSPPAAGQTSGIPQRSARAILRKLRDLDLRVRGLLVDSNSCVQLEGCLCPDAPIEEGLTYRLRLDDGSSASLDLAWVQGALQLSLEGAQNLNQTRRVEFVTDDRGRATAPTIQARMHPDACDPREVEHFLRRLIRAAFAAPSAA